MSERTAEKTPAEKTPLDEKPTEAADAGPEMQRVVSSNIDALGFSVGDGDTGTLQVLFGSGKTYVYEGVPASVYSTLLVAPSVGRAFGALVRGKYNYVKLGD